MKYYNLNSEITFGRHKGKTLIEAIKSQFMYTYFDWCCVNLEHFYISEEVISQIKEIVPNFELSEEAKMALEKKFDDWTFEQKRRRANRENYYADSTEWSNYNDDLDMDQQSPDFWNQF